MATLAHDNPVFTVLVQISTPPELQAELVATMLETAPVFAAQPGFVSSHLHRSHDGELVVNYLQWRSQADHEACLISPDVAAGGRPFMDFLERHGLDMDVTTYEIVQSLGA